MSVNHHAEELTVEELRELVPQLQQLTDRYKRAERIQKALFDISELASAVSELNGLYPAIHEIVANLMDARNFYVAINEGTSESLKLAYFIDEFDQDTMKDVPSSELKKCLTGHVLATGQHLFLTQENMQEQLDELGVTQLGFPPVDWIGVPLKRGSDIIGAMVVQSYDESVRYNNDDLEILLFVSQHIVTTLDRVKNRELTETTIRDRTRQLRTINEDLQEEIHERQKIESLQQALFEISELSAAIEEDMAVFYANLHDILSRLINAPNCYIAILDKFTNQLNFPYFSDELAKDIDSRPMSKGLTEYVLRTGQAALIDAKKAKELAEEGELTEATALHMEENRNSWLGSPLVVEGEIDGIIAIQSYSNASIYSLKDLELLRFVSHHIATAMERKRAADAIQKYNQQLTEMVEERTRALNQTNIHLKKQINERKEIELKLIHDAHHDSLTGLPNRTMFTNRLDLAVANKHRYQENNFAVLFIDLDRFKLINDTLGHHAGDMFLIEVAKRVGKCIRSHDLLARLGGDEFVILLDNFDNIDDAEEVARRIIRSLAQPFVLDDREMYSGASVGIAIIQPWYQSADEVIRDSDAAMYHAKTQGRGRFVVFDQSMREKLLDELSLENEFRRALKASQFECYYQPVMALDNQEYIYLECYIRWLHPTLGKVKRQQFWKVAEDSGLIIELDNFMLDRVCELLKSLQENDDKDKDLRVAINLSINHIQQPKQVKTLLEYIHNSGIDPKQLVFEFNENALNRCTQHVLPAMKKLKKSGITLVLDNFGSGLASLNYLYTYPFDYVKVDNRFVKSIHHSAKNLKLIQSVLSMSEHLGFKLIAEGIENDDQLKTLVEIGCEYGQGRFISASQKLESGQLISTEVS